MDDDKLNDKVHPPTSSPLAQQNDNFSSMNMVQNETIGHYCNNAGSIGRNPAFYPPDQSSATPSLWRQPHGNNQTNPKAPFDPSNNLAVDLNQPHNFQNPTNSAGNVPNPYRQYYPHPQRDNLINVHPQLGQNPGLSRNFSVNRGNNPEVIDLTSEEDNEQLAINLYGPRRGKNSFYQPQDAVTSSFNQNQVNASHLGSFRRADENFRALETGYKLTDVASPDVATRPPPIFGENLRFRNNMGGLLSSENSMGGLHSFQNNMGRLANSQNMGGLHSFQNNMGRLANSQNMGGLHSSQNNMGQLANSQISMGGLLSSRNNMGRLPNSQLNLDVFPSVRDRVGGFTSSQSDMGALANSQNNMGLLPNSHTNMGRLPSSQMHQGVFPRVKNNMGENNQSFVYSNSNLGYMPNTDTRYDPYEALRHHLNTPSGQLSNNINELSRPVQIGGVSNPPPGFFTSDATQKLYQPEMLNHLERNMASGQVPDSRHNAAQAGNEAAQLLFRRSNQLAVQTPQNYGQPMFSDPRGNPSLKRGSIHPNPSSYRVQRRRTVGQYQSSFRPQTPPVSATQIPTPGDGSEGGLRPSGHKCMLCKRDLAFSPEGPIQQPSIRPHVAVLPCHHTFHDICLERITPEDQKTNPPCIPCAIGEI